MTGEQDGSHTKRIRRWRECDEWDKPTPVVVALCAACSKRLIDPHPKLYIPIEADEPDPGSMPTCVYCVHRQGLRCRSPLLKANGGPGLPMVHPKPTWMHVCGTRNGRRTGWTTSVFRGAVTCKGLTPLALAPSNPTAE